MNQSQKPNRDICSIRIMFPVDSDEEAFAYKKKVAEVMANMPEAGISFNVVHNPQPPQPVQ